MSSPLRRLVISLALLGLVAVEGCSFQDSPVSPSTTTPTLTGVWTWMGGSNTSNAVGDYGTLGVAAVSNVPAAREGAVSWTDPSGNFWLFGGQNLSNLPFNDLWKFNPTTKLWTWVSGSSIPGPTGVYGTKGIAAASNIPSPRYGAVAWADTSGNLWLFGGASNIPNAFYNDLWLFNTQTSLWTWVSGSSTPNNAPTYGTQGMSASTNVPGSRNDPVNWIDSSGNLWLFGGGGYSANGFGGLNDLWMFSTSTRQWTWVSGSNSINQPGIYGTQGTASAANVPGAREWASSWMDSSNNLWLFGGWAGYGSTPPFLNDLWVFNTTTKQWTWVDGSATGNVSGIYGTQGTPAITNIPDSRMQASTWTDAKGNLWLFGGDEYIPPSTSTSSSPNDLWLYNPTSDEWTWISGTGANTGYPVYGILGTPSSANIPGGRSGAATWTDTSGNLWLFGGGGISSTDYGELNDLWRYQP